MRARTRSKTPTIGCVALALLFALDASVEAGTRSHWKHSSVSPVLQPFIEIRTALHSVADKIVSNVPRDVVKAATAPVRVSYKRPMRVAFVAPQAGVVSRSREEPFNGDEDESPRPPRRSENRGFGPMVSGNRAVLRGAIAAAPARAPQSVKNAIWAANALRRKPYIWGGGHGSFDDHGYDCSGTVSFALHHAGALAAPLPSSGFLCYGERGHGRWITIYARPGHTFATIAGLRLDTTDFENGGKTGPRWHVEGRDTGGYVARHPAGM